MRVKPEVCSAHCAPLSANATKLRLSTMPTMTIKSSASPTALSSTERKGAANIWAMALNAASSMGQR